MEPKWTVAGDLFGKGRGETGKSVGHARDDVKVLVRNAKKRVKSYCRCEDGGGEERRRFCDGLSAWLFCPFE
jgi:hypothetical protein